MINRLGGNCILMFSSHTVLFIFIHLYYWKQLFFRLEVCANQVKSVFLTATKLKMDRVAKECARHLIQHLSVENCIDIRSLPGIAKSKTFVVQINSYIANQVKYVEWMQLLYNIGFQKCLICKLITMNLFPVWICKQDSSFFKSALYAYWST